MAEDYLTKTIEERLEALSSTKLATTNEQYEAIGNSSASSFIRTSDQWDSYLQQQHGNHPLSGCDQAAIDAFTTGLRFNRGVLAGADYRMIADKLSYLQFMELWALFGISPTLFDGIKDQTCEPGGETPAHCVYAKGFTCFPSGCW
jgi:hypothetical protein